MMKVIAAPVGEDCIQIELTQDEITQRQLEELEFAAQAGRRLLLKQIAELESQQTPRRVREAALGIDSGWLSNLNTEIELLRQAL